MAALMTSRPPSEPDWSQSFPSLRPPERRRRQRDSRRRRLDPAHRRSGYPASCRQHSADEGQAAKTPTPIGRGPAWDSPRGSNRGAGRVNRGPHRGPLRGGQRGRWGRWSTMTDMGRTIPHKIVVLTRFFLTTCKVDTESGQILLQL
jgi:hypothetical protein